MMTRAIIDVSLMVLTEAAVLPSFRIFINWCFTIRLIFFKVSVAYLGLILGKRCIWGIIIIPRQSCDN